jgi:hypothetical protein
VLCIGVLLTAVMPLLHSLNPFLCSKSSAYFRPFCCILASLVYPPVQRYYIIAMIHCHYIVIQRSLPETPWSPEGVWFDTFAAQQHKAITIQSLPNLPVEIRGGPRPLLPLTHFSTSVSTCSPTGPTIGPCGFPSEFSSIFEPERFACGMEC